MISFPLFTSGLLGCSFFINIILLLIKKKSITIFTCAGQYMSPYDPDEGPSITGWRVQRWESSLKPVVLHQIFGNPTSSYGGQAPMQTVWVSKVDTSITPTNDFKSHQAAATGPTSDARKISDSGADKRKKVIFDPFDLPSDVRTLARIVYSAHGGEIAIAFLRGGVHIFSGPNFAPVDNYQINVGSAIAAPAFSSTSCCSGSVWHDTSKDRTMLKIIRVLPPAVPSSQAKANSSTWERAIAERYFLKPLEIYYLQGVNLIVDIILLMHFSISVVRIISIFCIVMLILFVGTDFGGAFWLELIGGMLLAVHRVQQRMALVRIFLLQFGLTDI